MDRLSLETSFVAHWRRSRPQKTAWSETQRLALQTAGVVLAALLLRWTPVAWKQAVRRQVIT